MRKNDIVIELVLGCERGGRMKRKALYLDDSEKELDALLENEDFVEMKIREETDR